MGRAVPRGLWLHSLTGFSPLGVVAASVAALEALEERVELVSRLLAQLPGPVLVVLRYLFTFLSQ